MSSGTLIVIGSNEFDQAKSVEYYNSVDNDWTKLLNLNVDRVLFESIVLEGKLMLVGGWKEGNFSNLVQSYDFPTGVMTTLSPLKQARSSHGVAVLARHLYVFGGDVGDYSNSVERYNPFNNTWTDILPMPTARLAPASAVLNDELYVIGGFNRTVKQLSTVESYNVITGMWTKCADMNERREDPAVGIIGDFIYVVGGSSSDGIVNTGERYDSVIDRWTFIRAMSVPRYRCRGLVFQNEFIVAGGQDEDDMPVKSVESYNNEHNNWKTIAPLVSPRTHFSFVEVPWKY